MKTLAIVGVVVFIATTVLARATNAQQFWAGSQSEMTIEQVKQAIPAAFVPTDPNHLLNGTPEGLRVIDVKIVSELFVGHFFFNSDKLVQVNLSLRDRQSLMASEGIFNNLLEMLRAKYGKERSDHDERGVTNYSERTWFSGQTSITLILFGLGKNKPALSVVYQVQAR